jgi:hypothetical protein
LQWAAWISSRANDAQAALRLARQAERIAFAEAEIPASQWQQVALTLARTQMKAGEDAASAVTYEKLAHTQWNPVARAVALLDFQAQATDNEQPDLANRAAGRLRTMNLTNADLQQAQAILRGLD